MLTASIKIQVSPSLYAEITEFAFLMKELPRKEHHSKYKEKISIMS